MQLEQASRKVVGLPASVNDDDRAIWLETLTRARGVPLPRVFHRRLRHRILFVQDVVEDDYVTTTTGHRTALTNEERFPTLVRVPTARGLGVSGQGHVREELFVFLVVHEVTDHTTETLGKFSGVRTNDELGLRELAHQVSREQVAAHLGFTMTRRHRDHQALRFPSNHTV